MKERFLRSFKGIENSDMWLKQTPETEINHESNVSRRERSHYESLI
jgi:hypothetical protein